MRTEPLAVLRLISLACCLVVLACAAWVYFSLGMFPKTWALLGLGVLLGMVSALGGIMGPKVTLASLATALCFTLGFTFMSQPILRVLPTAGILEGDENIRRADKRYGVTHIPGSSAIHRKEEFRVRYTIDALGHRVTPSPSAPIGRVTFHGCSFTFGDGVEDNETFTHLLGQRHWKRFKVRNAGTQGWGPPQSYLALQEELKQEAPPKMVFFGFLRLHIGRSYISYQHLKDWAGPAPHFEVEGDRTLFKGYVTREQAVMDSPELDLKSMAVSLGLLREMHLLCKQHKIPFYVLLFAYPKMVKEEVADIASRLSALGVPYLDLSEMGKDDLFPVDGHPTRAWHLKMASRLASSPRLKAHLEAAAAQ